jgi:hypothetical protein
MTVNVPGAPASRPDIPLADTPENALASCRGVIVRADLDGYIALEVFNGRRLK